MILRGLHTFVTIETVAMAGVGCLTFKLSAIKSDRQIKASGLFKLYFKGKSQGNNVINNMIPQKLFLKDLHFRRIQLILEFISTCTPDLPLPFIESILFTGLNLFQLIGTS